MPDPTPLSSGEVEDLLPAGLRTRADVAAFEKAAYLKGRRWALSHRRTPERVLTVPFLRELHTRIFGHTWKSAGDFRTHDQPGVVNAALIPVALMSATADANSWIAEETYFAREIAARFHHRLIGIHPWVHGNGRWSRLATDTLILSLHEPLPNWGSTSGAPPSRSAYGDALTHADAGDYEVLMRFMWA